MLHLFKRCQASSLQEQQALSEGHWCWRPFTLLFNALYWMDVDVSIDDLVYKLPHLHNMCQSKIVSLN